MAADINDKFTYANNGTLAVPAELAATKAVVDTTATLSLATGWPTATAVHFALFQVDTAGDKIPSTVTYWKATLSGTTLSNMTLTGGTNQQYEVGDKVIIYSTAEWANDLADGILTHANQDGTLKDNTVDSPQIVAGAVDNVHMALDSIDTPNVKDGAVTGVKIAGGSYSTTEVNTGARWTDGKDIWKKTISLGSLPNNSATTIAHGVTGLENIVQIEGVAYDGTTQLTLPYAHPGSGTSIAVFRSGANLTVNTGSNRTSYTGYATIWYTKT